MRYFAAVLLMVVSLQCSSRTLAAADSYAVMRLLLADADLVVLAEVIEEPLAGTAHEAASHFSWPCKLRVIETLKGMPPKTSALGVRIDLLSDHPFRATKGHKAVFFLKSREGEVIPPWATTDIRFSVQPASMAHELKRLAEEMRQQK